MNGSHDILPGWWEDAPKHLDRYSAHRRRNRLAKVIGVFLLVAAQIGVGVGGLVVPLRAAWSQHQARLLGLQTLVEPRPGLSARGFEAPPTGSSLVLLAYHDIEEHPRSIYALTPQQFADQIHVLRLAGYESATSEDLVGLLNGQPVEGHKVAITFDDGPRGLWTYADPILKENKFSAISFTITGRVGSHAPYYLTWDQMRVMQNSGRWSFESHTRLGHDRVPVSAKGDTAPFLTNRMWLSRENRLETIAEYTARIRDDLLSSRRDLADHGFPTPHLFAYPFSAARYPTNDPRLPDILHRIVADEFAGASQNLATAAAVSSHNVQQRLLPRIELLTGDTPQTLLRRVAMAQPMAVTQARLASTEGWSAHGVDAGLVVQGGVWRLTRGAGRHSSFYAVGRVESWTRYRLQCTVQGLIDKQSEGEVFTRVDGSADLRVAVKNARIIVLKASDTGVLTQLASIKLPRKLNHALQIDVRPSGTLVVVDGVPLWRSGPIRGLGGGGIGLASNASNGQSQPVFRGLSVTAL